MSTLIQFNKILMITLTLGAFQWATPSFAQGGSLGGGGGDAAEVEFSNMGQLIGDAYAKLHVDPGFDLNAFKEAVKTTQVNMLRHALIQPSTGKERDALNYPQEKKIEVNRNNWITISGVQKVELAFHEYLGIIQVERDIYTVSHMLMSTLGLDTITKIGGDALPQLTFHCSLKHENAENAVKQYPCGEADVTTDPFDPHKSTSAFFSACQMSVMISKFMDAGIDVELAQLKGANDGNWQSIQSNQYASFTTDRYSAPNAFSLSIGLKTGGLINKHTEQYDLTCQRN